MGDLRHTLLILHGISSEFLRQALCGLHTANFQTRSSYGHLKKRRFRDSAQNRESAAFFNEESQSRLFWIRWMQGMRPKSNWKVTTIIPVPIK